MAIRVKWDKFETAILIDAFWKIENDKTTKKFVVEETSKMLRKRAENLGVEIDDTFRNENGISMQLSSIAHSFFPDRPFLTSSKMFDEIILLYNNDKKAFNALLIEAINQSKGELNMNEVQSNKQLFTNWLADNKSNKISVNLAIRAFDEASEYGIMHHAFKKDLWSILDIKEFTDAVSRLLGMRLFHLMHKQTATTFSKIVPMYKSFLAEQNEKHVPNEPLDRTDAIYLIDLYFIKGNTNSSVDDASNILRKRAAKLDKSINDEYMCQASIEAYFAEIEMIESGRITAGTDQLLVQLLALRKNNFTQYKLQSDMVVEQLTKLGLLYNENISDKDTPCTSPVEVKNNVGKNDSIISTTNESTEPDYNDSLYLSDAIFRFLKAESERNKFGATLQYISSQVKAQDSKVKKILDSSDWAIMIYGRYFFALRNEESKKYDFAFPKSLSFTKPISISYFGDVISEATTWRKLYVDFMKVIYEDYPHIIDNIAGQTDGTSSVPLIMRAEDVLLAKAPGQFADGLYVEMNRSANDIMQNIKKILDACNVDYENIEVEYVRKQDEKTDVDKKSNEKDNIVAQNVFVNTSDGTTDAIKDDDKEDTAKDELITESEIVSILQNHYGFGFNINSPIELIKFRNYYAQEMDAECSISDSNLSSMIRKCGFEFNGKIYVLSQEIQEKLSSQINSLIGENVQIVYYEEYYFSNEDWLYDGKILSSEMLKSFLENTIKGCQFKNNFFLTNPTKTTELEALKSELIRVWGTQVLHTFNELKELLPLIPMDKIKYALSYGEMFTWNSLETYSRNDYFIISNEQIEELIGIASEKCAENGSTSFDELPLEDIASENYELSENALCDSVFKYLSDKFERNSRVIVMKGDKVDTSSAIIKYCSDKESCTMSELEKVMQDVSGDLRYPVVIEAANYAMTRVGIDAFVSDDHVMFDVQAVDAVLDGIVKGNGIGMLEITTFGAFPFCGYTWNHFVLESYCRKFSEKYKYMCITPNSKNAGAIVRKSCGLDYHEIMAEAIAKSKVEIDEKEVYDFLVQTGYMIKRQYNNMNDLLEKASLLRKGVK